MTDALRELLGRTRFELVPMKGVDEAVAALPPGAPVSVTCSPAKGIPATLDVAGRLHDLGHDTVPHLSARTVEDRRHVTRIAGWLRDHGVREVFVIAGDGARARGPYEEALPFLRDLLDDGPGLTAVGVPGYPDHHPFIGERELHALLRAKLAVIADAGLAGSVTTQMCLDPPRIIRWLSHERERGLDVPVDIGVAGVVDRAKLLTMGVRLGVGTSLRFLRKNRAVVTSMFAPGGYDPTHLVTEIADDAPRLGVRGLHSYTFNRVAPTLAWRARLLGE
jgi:methylenetetrahydrofolate reductase (NADPH)